MTSRDRVLQTLSSADTGLCDDCLSDKSGVSPRQQVYQRATELYKEGRIMRERGTCSSCKRFKLVNSIGDKVVASGEPGPSEARKERIALVLGR